ncbi:guanine nucleotide-binding protein subunit gamma 3 isoform X2 [Brassica rapa]|uniref:guanine nucleotide-binding protein subunit gamma 3 isoform X2 n=1 Tax=Brassica campestris TaxID=3711 RepID=UPI00142D88F4|nr:guanine nucleotide-binding protein subunit gamma 3 isoform X2 [Brassica rapa]
MSAPSCSVGGEVGGETCSALAKSSLPPPRPKSPPEYPDLYGKRRVAARVQMLEREIGFLEGEIKFIQGVQPASRCCKEVSDFVVANSDPLIPAQQKSQRHGRFWKWLCEFLLLLPIQLFVPSEEAQVL